MNTMRMLAVGVVVCLVTGSALAEEKKADNAKLLVGKWEVTKAEQDGPPIGAIVEFTKDGKLKVSFKNGDQDVSFDGTYKVDGNKFTFTMKMGDQEHTDTITIKKISKTEMSTENKEGKGVDLVRKK